MNYTRLEKQLQDPAFDFLKRILQARGAEIFWWAERCAISFWNEKQKTMISLCAASPPPELELLLKKIWRRQFSRKNIRRIQIRPKKATKIQDTRYKSLEPFDIALPRTEHSLSMAGGYKDFAVQSDHKLFIEDDLKRRDFTVNAIAFKISKDQD